MSDLAVYYILLFCAPSAAWSCLQGTSVSGLAGFSRIALLPVVGFLEGGGRLPALPPRGASLRTVNTRTGQLRSIRDYNSIKSCSSIHVPCATLSSPRFKLLFVSNTDHDLHPQLRNKNKRLRDDREILADKTSALITFQKRKAPKKSIAV